MVYNKRIEPTSESLAIRYPSPDMSLINLDPFKNIKKNGRAYAKIMHRFESVFDNANECKDYPTCLVCIPEDEKSKDDIICLSVKDMYSNAIDLVLMLANKLASMEVCLKTIKVSDKATFHLLKDFCRKAGIKLEKSKEEDVDEGLKDLMNDVIHKKED